MCHITLFDFWMSSKGGGCIVTVFSRDTCPSVYLSFGLTPTTENNIIIIFLSINLLIQRTGDATTRSLYPSKLKSWSLSGNRYAIFLSPIIPGYGFIIVRLWTKCNKLNHQFCPELLTGRDDFYSRLQNAFNSESPCSWFNV